jgi:hypothetical protein
VRETIVVSGAVAQKPHQAGHTWQFLQYLLGFRRLGWDVLFVDRLDASMCAGADGQPSPPEQSANVAYFADVMRSCGLADSCALLVDGESVFGLDRRAVLERTRRAALLLNVMGYLDDEELLAAAPKRVFLDTDPGFGQMWLELGLADIFRGHDVHVTIAENIGRPNCAIPTCGIDWRTTKQPVVLDLWRRREIERQHAFTSVGAWRGPYAPISLNGVTYGLRVHEFRKFAHVPRLSGGRFDIALDIDSADSRDLDLLRDNGWQLISPRQAAGDLWTYRSFLQSSFAEFMVARGIYVQTRSGWFSERSICYLASGTPVLAQDTGLDGLLPVGEGLLTFTTADEAAAGVESITAAHRHHARAAGDLAEAYFDSDLVLGRLLATAGVG